MRAIILQLIVASLVLALSMGFTWPPELEMKLHGSRASLGQRAMPLSGGRARTRKKRKFKFVERTCESGCSERYESPDGHEVWLTLACYTSTGGEARAEMRRMIGEGTVVKRGWRHYGHRCLKNQD